MSERALLSLPSTTDSVWKNPYLFLVGIFMIVALAMLSWMVAVLDDFDAETHSAHHVELPLSKGGRALSAHQIKLFRMQWGAKSVSATVSYATQRYRFHLIPDSDTLASGASLRKCEGVHQFQGETMLNYRVRYHEDFSRPLDASLVDLCVSRFLDGFADHLSSLEPH